MAVGLAKTVVSAVTTCGVAVLVAEVVRVDLELDPKDDVLLAVAVLLAAVESAVAKVEMTGIVVDTPDEVVAAPARLANPIAAGWYRYTE